MGRKKNDYEITLLMPKDKTELERIYTKALVQIALKKLTQKEMEVLIDRLERR